MAESCKNDLGPAKVSEAQACAICQLPLVSSVSYDLNDTPASTSTQSILLARLSCSINSAPTTTTTPTTGTTTTTSSPTTTNPRSGHTFHEVCLRTWAQHVNTCPLDRIQFTSYQQCDSIDGPTLCHIPVPDPPQPQPAEDSQVPRMEDRYWDVDDEDEEGCQVCSESTQEDQLLICDGCQRMYHLYCLQPPLPRVPDGDWFCQGCQDGGTRTSGGNRRSSTRRTRHQQRRTTTALQRILQRRTTTRLVVPTSVSNRRASSSARAPPLPPQQDTTTTTSTTTTRTILQVQQQLHRAYRESQQRAKAYSRATAARRREKEQDGEAEEDEEDEEALAWRMFDVARSSGMKG